ncbi:aldehyde dehydrogenase family protein [Streptomyces sp. Tu102]|uniref:aldehyde dehydrogenase family protein n=1 Tax=Streptomyces sp. Tu102 TaxID=2838019 RepID=UPI001BDDB974|nr:aldehyde dehydrogenase family protein [Streptomyces sp. Tu102]MBT1094109.1 aldehyde dehydrogenase family protein [Streptomyces sp. Tu102]
MIKQGRHRRAVQLVTPTRLTPRSLQGPDLARMTRRQLSELIDSLTPAMEVQREQVAGAFDEVDDEDFPALHGNPEVSAMIDQRAYNRVTSLIDEARERGFRVIQPDIYAGVPSTATTRQLPLTVVVNPNQSLRLHQTEVFGPVLSVYKYRPAH